MRDFIVIFISVCAGMVAGVYSERDTESHRESEAALIAAEQAGMERMQEAMRNMIMGVCVK